MVRKSLLSIIAPLAALLLLTTSSFAQAPEADDDAPAVVPVMAQVQQIVPLTLTVVIPSPTGPISLEVPVFLTLDLRIGLGSDLTATVAVTPSVGVALTETMASETTETTDATAPTPEPVAAATATPAPPVAVATPTPLAPTATPLAAVALPTPTLTPTPAIVPATCPDPRAVIASPGVNQIIAGLSVTILGSATHEQFQYFKLEYAPGADAEDGFAFLSETRSPVSSGVLGILDSTVVPNGPLTVRLTVVDTSGNFPPPCSVTVIVQN